MYDKDAQLMLDQLESDISPYSDRVRAPLVPFYGGAKLWWCTKETEACWNKRIDPFVHSILYQVACVQCSAVQCSLFRFLLLCCNDRVLTNGQSSKKMINPHRKNDDDAHFGCKVARGFKRLELAAIVIKSTKAFVFFATSRFCFLCL